MVPVEEPQKYGVVVGVTEQPAPASGVVVGVLTEQPGGRGSIESLGRWNEKDDDRAMPIKMRGNFRLAFSKFVDELVQNGASGGILAVRGGSNGWCNVSWSASPDDTSYQRHGSVDGTASTKHGNVRFADFEGVVDDFGAGLQMAVYRVTLPSGGLDPWKWVDRPPPPAPEDLYTGPRSDGLLSTEEMRRLFRPCLAPFCLQLDDRGAARGDAIEAWASGCLFGPPCIAPMAGGGVWTRKPGTNAFRNEQNSDLMAFDVERPAGLQKTPRFAETDLPKVGTRDLAGKWCGLGFVPFVTLWRFRIECTTKGARRGPVRGVGARLRSVFADSHFRNAHAQW